jgi:hypothetical protein
MQASVTALLASTLLSAGTAYPVVAHLGSVPVRAPARAQAWGGCPAHTTSLDRKGLVTAKHAALLALPTVARRVQPPLKIRGARVVGLRHTHPSGDILPTRRSCRGTAFKRSALVQLFLPAERRSPDIRGNPWFYVARSPTAWVVWEEVH